MNKQARNCLLCGRELSLTINWLYFTEKFQDVICTRCKGGFEKIDFKEGELHLSLYRYNEAMKDYLHRYKFMRDIVLAKVFQKDIYAALGKKQGIVVPIPLHPEKLKERTFAQVDEMLKAANIPFVHVLNKVTIETQSSKTRAERLATAQLFEVKVAISPKHYILFDDIYTTGTTITHAKNALLEAGAKSVESVTLIRG